MDGGQRFFLAVIVSSGLAFVAGTRAETSMRDPVTLLVFCAWLVSIAAVLVAGWRMGQR